MLEWFKRVFLHDHELEIVDVEEARENLRAAAERHIKAERESEITSRATTLHTNGLQNMAEQAMAAIKRGEANGKS